MEKLKQIRKTLSQINKRTPDVCLSKFIDSVLTRCRGTEHAPPEQEDDTDDDDDAGQAPIDSSAPQRPRSGSRQRALKMNWASCVLPRHGEDAHFGHAKAGFIGVADGVGGYRDQGVDAGAFARELMANALSNVKLAAKDRKLRRTHPKNVLEKAYETAVAKGTPGASTAVILSLDRTNLRWAYIGDSAFAVLRGGKIVYRSVQQQSRFNCPFQLCANGGGDELSAAKFGGMSTAKDGDVVVLGTDGLFDKVHEAQLERAVRMGTQLGFSPKNMADIIAGIAYDVSRNDKAWTPYSVGYLKAYMKDCGGKKDDITVIVAYIVSKNP